MPQTYTNPGGLTPQALQTAQSNLLMGNAASVPSTQQLGGAYTDASQNLAGMQTPEAREQVISGTDVPAMQTNYDDMARKLFEYDKMHLSPKYSQAPAQPSDRLSYGRVGESDLMQLTPEMASGPTTLYADNPTYAVKSQAAQQENIIDLLGTLNNAIAKEFGSAKGKYASTVKAQQSLVDSIFNLMKLKSDEEQKKLDRAEKAAEKAKGEKGVTVETEEGVLLVDPYTGETIKNLGKKGKKQTQADKDDEVNALSGLEAVKSFRGNLTGRADLFKSVLPYGLGDQEAQLLRNAAREFKDILSRIRTGATLNKEEIREYENNIPNAFDTSASIEDKLNRLERLYSRILERSGGNLNDVQGNVQSNTGEWEVVQ